MNEVQFFHICALKGAVKLESKGLKRRGESAKSIAIKELGLKRNSSFEEVIAALETKIEESLHYENLGKGHE